MKHQENMSMQWNSVTRHAKRQRDNNKELIESCLGAGDKLASIFWGEYVKISEINVEYSVLIRKRGLGN